MGRTWSYLGVEGGLIVKVTDNIVCTACKHFGDGKTLATHETEKGLKLCDKHYTEWMEANDPICVEAIAIEVAKNLGNLPEAFLRQYKRGLLTPQEACFQLYERGLLAPCEYMDAQAFRTKTDAIPVREISSGKEIRAFLKMAKGTDAQQL